MLRFLPNLSTLKLVDEYEERRYFLSQPNHTVAIKIKSLRGLKELEVVLGEDMREGDSEAEGKYSRDAANLTAQWEPLATQPKYSDG